MQVTSTDAFYKSESRYRMLVENSCDIIFSLDTKGVFTFVSCAWKTVLGHDLSDVVGHNLREFIHPEDVHLCSAAILAAIETNSAQEVTARIRHAGGNWRRHILRGAPHVDEDGLLTIIGMTHDVTERLRIEEIMIQSEKMLMISGLAAGMAHEINNPLGAILQHAQNIERRVSADIPANHAAAAEVGVSLELVSAYLQKRGIFGFIEHIRIAGIRASDIISNMLSFSRRSTTGAEFVDLTVLLERVLELAASDYDMKKKYNFAGIELRRLYGEDLPPVRIIKTELEQVLLNILKNAAQAFEATAVRPQITLRTRIIEGMAIVEIEDNATGMDEATRMRVFEPFFSTKDVGGGTGMGLAVAYSIITKGHQGAIEVQSHPGVGSCFIVKLPLRGRA